MTPRERADRAKQILDDPVFNQAFGDIREGYVRELERLELCDMEKEHELTLRLQTLKKVRLQLISYTNEAMVDNAVEREQSWIKRAKQTLMP